MLNESIQLEPQSVGALRSFSNKVESVVELMCLMPLVSSVSKRAVADGTESGRSFINIMNNRGPKEG